MLAGGPPQSLNFSLGEKVMVPPLTAYIKAPLQCLGSGPSDMNIQY
jgi:hypothetical protein